MSPTAPSSPPPSPQAPASHIPALSRILVWNVRRRNKAVEPRSPLAGTPTTTVEVPTSPVTVSNPQKRTKSHHIECSSGTELKTHDRLVDCHPECRNSDVIVLEDVFVCMYGVDTARLLSLSRRRIFEKVELLGGNAIIDERWSCTICKHHSRRGDIYKVSIKYQGTPARCSLPDPQRPVAATETKGVPGLMTILSRQ